MVYNIETIKPELSKLENWKFMNEGIEKQFVFKKFTDVMAFMVKVSYVCESLDHHPEWTNVYNKLSIRLSTHDKGGVTDKDIELANEIEKCNLFQP